MRVFVLCTGRCGSTTFIKACGHIENYTASHESLARRLDETRFDYPDNHIEADNRLSWFLGELGSRFNKDTLFVHLLRNKADTVLSLNKRWHNYSINKAFVTGICMTSDDKLSEDDKLKACAFFYDTINNNIRCFLAAQPNKLTVNLEKIKEDFACFWALIGAKGDFDAAIAELEIHHNASDVAVL